jgi:ABC-2 type transport system permease protein
MIYQWPSFYGYMIQKGQATADFLRPQNLFMMLFCRYFGIAIYQNLMVLILILFSSPFWISNIQVANFSNTLFFIMCIPSAVIIQFFTELLVGMLAFFITEINGFTLNYGFLYSMFTGKMFPLSLIISVFSINLLNPYSYLFYHPMQIYLGKYTTNEIIYVFLGGLAWCVILAALAQGVFKAGLKRNESVGL